MPQQDNSNRYFDAGYGIASVAISGTGVTVVATTQARYHGVSFLAASTALTVKIYNASSGTSNLIDVISVGANGTGWSDKYIPVVCKTGLTVSVTGSAGSGVIFFSPKG